MQYHGTPGWKISVDEPYLLLFALFIRDAVGLSGEEFPSLPPLFPVVPPLAESVPDREKAGQQWKEWWSRLLDAQFNDPRAIDLKKDYAFPEFLALQGSPELRACARLCFREAAHWINTRRHEQIVAMNASMHRAIEQGVVREIAEKTGEEIKPFDLRIITLPIEGKQTWLIAPDQAIIGRELVSEADAYRAWLRQVVAALA